MKTWELCLAVSGAAIALGGALHIAIIFGGPAWYRFFGAPERLARMAGDGHWYPALVCSAIAMCLFVCAGYAFSGAGLIGRWPFLPAAVAVIGGGLILRALAFVPLMVISPRALAGITNSVKVDTFLVLSSLFCLAVGAGYANALRYLLAPEQ